MIRRKSISKTVRAIFMTLLVGLGVTLIPEAHAGRALVSLNLCAPPTEDQKKLWLRDEWQPYISYVRICAIRDAKSRPVIYVVSVWMNLYNASKRPGIKYPTPPKPKLVDREGKIIGAVPVDFPYDPPNVVELSFTPRGYGAPKDLEFVVKTPQGARHTPVTLVRNQDQKYERKW